MLYIALILATILLIVVNLIAWKAKYPVLLIMGAACLIPISSFFLMFLLYPVLLQAGLVCLAALIWGATRYRARFFLALSCLATVVAFGVQSYFVFQETRRLQEAFPYISMDERLPAPKAKRFSGSLPFASKTRLDATEALVEEKQQEWESYARTSSLREIHANTVRLFVNRPGFGVTRMIYFTEASLRSGTHEEPPIPQPGTPSASPWLPAQLQKEPVALQSSDGLLTLHRDSTVDFANIAGFGYIKDRQHVAGFQEHQFSQKFASETLWQLQRLDLIGLLLHEKPIAYVSEHLPRMQELRAAPLRDLDEFESAGLPELQAGEELYVRQRGPERRMLGAIRAARQCLSCHEAERGALLGAFSYRLTE